SAGVPHEVYVGVFRSFVLAVGRALRIRTRCLGSALWERPLADAAKAPDIAFYVASSARIGNRIPAMETDPVPDLAIQAEIPNPAEHSLQAYANPGVPEVWHFARRPGRAASLRFLRLEGGTWVPSTSSLAFPQLEAAKVLPLIEQAAPLDDLDRADLFDAW